MADLDALARAACGAPRPGGGGLQRRRRLGLPRLGRPRHARARTGRRPSPPCRRRWPATSTTTAPRWRAEWGLRVGRGRHRRDGRRRLPRATTATAASTARTALMDARRSRWPTAEGATVVLGRQRRRPRRPPARPAGRRRAGRRLPAGRRRLHQGRGAGGVARASACARGTSRPRPAWPRGCPTARR